MYIVPVDNGLDVFTVVAGLSRTFPDNCTSIDGCSKGMPDRASSLETQEDAFGPAAEKGRPSSYQ